MLPPVKTVNFISNSMVYQQLKIDVPEKVLLAEKTDAESFGKELCTLAAVKLYELGRLSSGVAAELAGMSRVAFNKPPVITRSNRRLVAD